MVVAAAAATVVAAVEAAILVAAATATVTVVAAMVTAMAGVAGLAVKATALSSTVPPQQRAANTTISLKRDARQRCQQQRQATGNKQPAQQKDKRAAQHICQQMTAMGAMTTATVTVATTTITTTTSAEVASIEG